MLLALILFSKRKLFVIIPLLFLVILIAFLLPSGVKERALFTFAQPKEQGQLVVGGVRVDTSTSARLISWKNVLTRDFIEQPILGYGVTGYSFLDAQYPRVLAETGLLGLFFFIALLIAIYRNALKAWRRYADDPFYLGISTGFLVSFFAMLTHAIGANTFIIVRIMEPFWFLTAIVIMIPQITPSPLPDAQETNRILLKPL
jgi:O-antigen ligase